MPYYELRKGVKKAMKGLRHWINNHVGIALIIALAMFAVSGWAAYRYAQQMGLMTAADSGGGSGGVAHTHSGCCGGGGGGVGGKLGKLFEIGQKTLAGDAVRKHLQKETQGEAQVTLQDMKIDASGVVLVTALVDGKERRFHVDLSVPQGKVTEVQPRKALPAETRRRRETTRGQD